MEALANYLINEQLEKNPVGKQKDVWGGVGVACIDWNKMQSNVLAAVTMVTNRLEVWQVDLRKMISIMDLEAKVTMIKWSPSN